jgi:hypothetical protein
MFFDHHTLFNALIIFRACYPVAYIISASSVFGKYGSQVSKFGTASNDANDVHL